MTIYYKSVRYIDGKARWVVTDEDGNINKSPTKEQLKIGGPPSQNICSKCNRSWTSGVWYNKEGEKGKLCSRCHQNEQNDKFRKPLANYRTGNLSRYCAHGLGFIGAKIVANYHDMDDCNIKVGDLCFYVDLFNTEYGLSEVKTRSLSNFNTWFAHIKPWNFDSLFLVSMDKNKPWKDVMRIYVIPSEFVDVESITIYNTISTKSSRWDKFQIDEKSYNDAYHRMKMKNCTVLRK